jgi:hypothetical protein
LNIEKISVCQTKTQNCLFAKHQNKRYKTENSIIPHRNYPANANQTDHLVPTQIDHIEVTDFLRDIFIVRKWFYNANLG